MLRDFLVPKDPLVEWAYQECQDQKVWLASPARRAFLAYLETRGQKERKGRRGCLALGFQDSPGTRETRA